MCAILKLLIAFSTTNRPGVEQKNFKPPGVNFKPPQRVKTGKQQNKLKPFKSAGKYFLYS